jgi:hypothetical protein
MVKAEDLEVKVDTDLVPIMGSKRGQGLAGGISDTAIGPSI